MIRTIYIIISVILTILAWWFCSDIVTDSTPFKLFTYIGTVSTIIGFIVAVCEIIHNIQISESIKQEAIKLYDQIKSIENASSLSDCIAAIDDINNCVMNENYYGSIKSFQFFRKILVKIPTDLSKDPREDFKDSLNLIELELYKFTSATNDALPSKGQKTKVMKEILKLKKIIEELNPALEAKNATS